MYTYDEWGRSVLHIQTGTGGMKLWKEVFPDSQLSPEEYKKHIDSHNKRVREENDRFMEQLMKIFKGD